MNICQVDSESIKTNNADSHTVFIESSNHIVQIAFYNNVLKLFVGVKQFIFDPDEDIKNAFLKIIHEHLLNHVNIQNVVFSHCSHRSMLVPQSLFDANHLNDFLKFHHHVDENDFVYYHELADNNIYVIYTIPNFYNNVLSQHFNDITLLHQSIPFLCNAIKNSSQALTPIIHAYIGSNFFFILVIKQGKIQLYNSFFYQKHTDILYFFANIANLFSLPPNNSQITISGNISADFMHDMIDEIKKVFVHVKTQDFPNNIKIAEELLVLPSYQINTLIGLQQCV